MDIKCKYCGGMFKNTLHEKRCAKYTEAERKHALQRRSYYMKHVNGAEPPSQPVRASQPIDWGAPQLNGKRVQITLSVDMDDLKALLGQVIPSLSVEWKR